MAYYLVSARPRNELMKELGDLLKKNSFINLRPFGKALSHSLNNARIRENGSVAWEEEDYCTPPLAMERSAVLDKYFDNIQVKSVTADDGWKQIQELPLLFPQLKEK